MAAAPASSVIVLESSDDERVPTDEEVNEYAEFLGLDPQAEPDLMWIAREGVIAPVPAPWKACTENGDDVFYFNFETGDSVWDHPSDEKYRTMVEDERKKAATGSSPTSPAGPTSPTSVTSPSGDKVTSVNISLESSGFDLPKDDLSDLLPSGASPEAKAKTLPPLGVEHNGLSLAPAAVDDRKSPKACSSAPTAIDDRKRLESITNEISDEEDMPESSPTSPAGESAGSPAKSSPGKTTANRGSAGVGISPARGLAVDTSLDKSGDMGEQSLESSTSSSPVASNANSAPTSQSGGRALPRPKDSSVGSGEGKSGILERSGQSGKSSNLSEVSEDFPSDFERSDVSPHGGMPTSLGDSLEISATMMDGDAASLPSAGAAKAESSSAPTRLRKVQDELASLAKVLTKLQEIRGHQREYLQLLQSSA